MATRTTTSTVTETTQLQGQSLAMPRLQFNEALSWRAGRSIPIADLLRRLQALSKEMRGMEQEEDDRESFNTVAKELASPNLLGHKDNGIKAWTACCLVDILRLCAPDAPYTGQQLKDIFNFLITSIFPALSDPSNAYSQQHLYVLNSLAQVKSIVLLTDIPSSEKLLIHLFELFFDILAGPSRSSTGEQVGKNVEFHMTSILVTMVDEAATLPTEAIDVIVAQFLRTDPRIMNGISGKGKKTIAVVDEKQSTLTLKELPPAYNMARTICNTCSERMARYISQYFNDVIVDASSSSAAQAPNKKAGHRRISEDLDDYDAETTGPTEDDLKELEKVHLLLRELWRACPAVLQNVVPQLEAELSAENVHLRTLATETFGDIISGVGAAGLSTQPPPDPAAYPPLSLADSSDSMPDPNILTKPSSPHQFPQAHPQAFQSFLGRSHDKSPVIRSAWTTGIGRILITSAGGAGLGHDEEDRLIRDLANMLQDADDRVRIAAVKAVGRFSFHYTVLKLGSYGGLDDKGSVLAVLSDRVRDKKHAVREEAMTVLARLWGVAIGAMSNEEEQVISTLGAVPSKILDTYYTSDIEIGLLLDHILFEQLLPLNYPPVKSKSAKLTNGHAQEAKDHQTNGDGKSENIDPDKVRTERILILAKYLDEKAKKVFFMLQNRQLQLSKMMAVYLQRCEHYNGGVMDEDEKKIKEHLTRLINSFSKQLPDSSKVTDSLWKFTKMHDRRSYQLIRYCMAPDSDYRTVVKAIKELTKRIEQNNAAPRDLMSVLLPLVYRTSLLVYNRSHVQAIIEFSRTDEKSLAATAHEILKDISTRMPEILRAHVQEICTLLQDEAPTSQKKNSPQAIDNLKACASFASRFADEIPRDRKFVHAMTNFALHGTPAETAKHAVTILMTASNKKEMLATDLLQKCIRDFRYGQDGFLPRLATLSQLMLLAPIEVEQESDAVSDIAIEEILLQVRTSPADASDTYVWSSTVDAECEAKCWALKILVNRVRSYADQDALSDIADPVYKVLLNLVVNEGECSPARTTPPTHKPYLRLLAARLFLKLCTKKPTDVLVTPNIFNALALVAQDPILNVRTSFLQRLKKYLGRSKLPQRFYTLPFLLAFEPNHDLKSDITTWIRSRASYLSLLKDQQPASKTNMIMESVFARLLSLLAHHPDYATSAEDLTDFARYLVFYLRTVATENNLSLIYHIAQRIKQSRDVVSPSAEYDSHLYHLSDLAQLTIRKFEEAQGWNIQTLPGKARLPSTLFAEVKDHEEAQKVAEKIYLPEGVEEGIEGLIKATMKAARSHGKKRRSENQENSEERGGKRVKSLTIRKAPTKEKKAKPTKVPKKSKRKNSEEIGNGERRRSGRANVTGARYVERDDEEDDDEMAEGVAVWEYEDGKQVKDDGGNDEDSMDDAVVSHVESDPEEEVTKEPTRTPPKSSPNKGKKPVTKLKGAKKAAGQGR